MSDEAYRMYQEGRRALESGDRRQAIECLQRSAALAPHFKTYELLGEALMETGRYPDAVLNLAAAAGLGRMQFRARYLLANALLALGPEWAVDAVHQLKESIRLHPEYTSAKQLLDEVLSRDRELAARIAEGGEADHVN